MHGEADLVEQLLRETGGTRVLDAGCGMLTRTKCAECSGQFVTRPVELRFVAAPVQPTRTGRQEQDRWRADAALKFEPNWPLALMQQALAAIN